MSGTTAIHFVRDYYYFCQGLLLFCCQGLLPICARDDFLFNLPIPSQSTNTLDCHHYQASLKRAQKTFKTTRKEQESLQNEIDQLKDETRTVHEEEEDHQKKTKSLKKQVDKLKKERQKATALLVSAAKAAGVVEGRRSVETSVLEDKVGALKAEVHQ